MVISRPWITSLQNRLAPVHSSEQYQAYPSNAVYKQVYLLSIYCLFLYNLLVLFTVYDSPRCANVFVDKYSFVACSSGGGGAWGEALVLHISGVFIQELRSHLFTHSELNKQFLLTVTYSCNYAANCWSVTQAPVLIGADTSAVLKLWSAKRLFCVLYSSLNCSVFLYLHVHPFVFIISCILFSS